MFQCLVVWKIQTLSWTVVFCLVVFLHKLSGHHIPSASLNAACISGNTIYMTANGMYPLFSRNVHCQNFGPQCAARFKWKATFKIGNTLFASASTFPQEFITEQSRVRRSASSVLNSVVLRSLRGQQCQDNCSTAEICGTKFTIVWGNEEALLQIYFTSVN